MKKLMFAEEHQLILYKIVRKITITINICQLRIVISFK